MEGVELWTRKWLYCLLPASQRLGKRVRASLMSQRWERTEAPGDCSEYNTDFRTSGYPTLKQRKRKEFSLLKKELYHNIVKRCCSLSSSEISDRKTAYCKNQGTDNIHVPAPADEAVGKPDPYKGYGKQGGHETKATTSSTAIRLSCFRTLSSVSANSTLRGRRLTK